MLKIIIKSVFIFLLVFVSFGCEKETTETVHEMHWDRDMCDRCKMVISERKHGVQVINKRNNKVYKFDDIGCAISWFKEEKIDWKDESKIWITDVDTGKWINARTAFYDTMTRTPMSYGFAAHETKESIEKEVEIIDFIEMSKRVLERNK
ncbi:nitrous oxide reductase accessory protein NosL [Campylobacterota bacterium DY0563]